MCFPGVGLPLYGQTLEQFLACVGAQKMLAKWKAGEKGRKEGRKEGRKGFIILTDQF